jgi:uncharacterized protein (DUF1330 family)
VEDEGRTYVLLARVPAAGVAQFAAYEDAVLPLLAEHGARLDLRLRAAGGQVEVHLVRFPSEAALAAYRADPRRAALADTLAASGAATDLFPLPG